MTAKEMRGCIDYRVDFINKKLGLNINVEKNTYGYHLYIPSANGGETSGGLHFVYTAINKAMTGREMLAYLDGIMELYIDIHVGNIKISTQDEERV